MNKNKRIIEYDAACSACGGTGLYVGMGERDGAAVVCHSCKGTGCVHERITYEPFTARKDRANVHRVFQSNPGICVGGDGRSLKLSDFGGQSFADWKNGKLFKRGSEMRNYTCPAWWYQTVDYMLKPTWDECIGCGAFIDCKSFATKARCWERFDAENPVKP